MLYTIPPFKFCYTAYLDCYRHTTVTRAPPYIAPPKMMPDEQIPCDSKRFLSLIQQIYTARCNTAVLCDHGKGRRGRLGHGRGSNFFVENHGHPPGLHCDRIGKSPGSKPHWQNIWHCSFPAATLPARPGGKQRGGRSGSRHWHSEVQVTAGRHGEGAIESGAARTFKSASV